MIRNSKDDVFYFNHILFIFLLFYNLYPIKTAIEINVVCYSFSSGCSRIRKVAPKSCRIERMHDVNRSTTKVVFEERVVPPGVVNWR